MCSLLPIVPALNKWDNMFQPTVWWLVASKIAGGVIASAFRSFSQDLEDWANRPLLQEDHVVGLNDRDAYRLKQGVRFRKAGQFLADHMSGMRLSVAVVGMMECLAELAAFFRGSKLAAPSDVRQWAHPITSPGVHACERCAAALLAPESPRWQLVHGGEGWVHTSLHMCATAMLGLLGDVYLRCVLPFDRFPWRLCQLFHDAVGDRDRRALGGGSCCAAALLLRSRIHYEAGQAL